MNTHTLLRFGVIVGPLYLATGIIQGLVRDGFDFMRHPLSVLANGPGGWVQTANFLVSGLIVIAAAIGFARVLKPTSRAPGLFLGAYGVCITLAAFFPADPIDGFPVGTPAGMPTTITTPGLIHFIVGALGFLCLGISALIATRAMSRRNEPGLSRLSLFTGLAVIIGFFGGAAIPGIGILGIWFAVVMGWLWLAIISMRLARM